MSPRDYRTELMVMIDRLLSNAWSVNEFRRAYYLFWVEEVPRDILTDEDEEFFSSLQEQLDWTAEAPTSEEKEYA